MAARMTEVGWTQFEDPRRMMRYLLRHPRHRPTLRKTALFGAACARLVEDPIVSDNVRRLVECREKVAEDVIWLDQFNALLCENGADTELPQHPARAIVLTFPALSIVEAALNTPDIMPGLVSSVIREIYGNPFRKPKINPLWLQANDGTVRKLAQGIYDEMAYDRLPILADALLDADCDDEDLVGHCRSDQRHFRGCWAVDALLGKTEAEPDQTAWFLPREKRSQRGHPGHESRCHYGTSLAAHDRP